MANAKDNKFDARLRLALHARTHGIRAAAEAFGAGRNTVRRWLRRFVEGGRAALRDLSRAPKTCPHRASPHHERAILKARAQVPCLGPQRLKDLFALKPSTGAIARVLRQNGLTRKPRSKRQKKNDLRAIKARYKPFERLQADTKPLYDIAAYWSQMQGLALPRQQYTMLDVKSGALFVDYANELSTTYATMATERILGHLRRWGADLDAMVLTTDNGSEYGGADRHERQSGFHARIETLGPTHRYNPPATPNAHGNVESSHHFVESELFDLEAFRSRRDFFEKLSTYQRWWNFARPNYSKGKRTPAQILEEEGIDPRILLLTPADLDYMFRHGQNHTRVGPHVPVDTAGLLW